MIGIIPQEGAVTVKFNGEADNLPTSDDESQSRLDLQDPISSPPPSHEAFTSHLDIPPDQTMDTELPHSETTWVSK